MSPETFVRKLKQLGYTPHHAEKLGISRSSAFRYAAGTKEVPEIVVRLLYMYELFGVPPAAGKAKEDMTNKTHVMTTRPKPCPGDMLAICKGWLRVFISFVMTLA